MPKSSRHKKIFFMKNTMILIGVFMFAISCYSQETGTFIDDRDNKTYKTVKIQRFRF